MRVGRGGGREEEEREEEEERGECSSIPFMFIKRYIIYYEASF
jgi:hypothetical protein